MQRVGIVGTGLIGASIGAGLRMAGWHVVGWDPDGDALETALEVAAIDDIAASESAVVDLEPDVIVLSGPPHSIVSSVAALETSTLAIDVAGVKGPICAAAPPGQRFVGTHPMAGRERSGPAAASPALFRGAAWVVCTDGADPDDLDRVEALVTTLGARAVRMTAEAHDDAVAVISHLPQVLAATLMTEATERTEALDLAAGSFRDLTRVAASDPSAWAALLEANADAVKAAITDLGTRLADVAALLDESPARLESYLETAQQARRTLAPPVVAVRVALADQPGEIARVGRALESSAVDLRDLQLRHAPHGGGGVLTLSVRPGEAEPLRAALEEQGLLLAT